MCIRFAVICILNSHAKMFEMLENGYLLHIVVVHILYLRFMQCIKLC